MSSISEAAAELREIARDFESSPTRVREQMGTVVSVFGHKVEAQAKVYVPVDTGTLKNSIGTEIVDKGDTATATVSTEVEYAGYVEWGTRNMLPQPYLGPAVDFYEESFAKALLVVVTPDGFR